MHCNSYSQNKLGAAVDRLPVMELPVDPKSSGVFSVCISLYKNTKINTFIKLFNLLNYYFIVLYHNNNEKTRIPTQYSRQ